MRTDPTAVANVERRANFLKEQTGKRSWAAIIQDSDQFQCLHCHGAFDPDEIQVAHHFARKCISPAVVVGAAL